MKQQIELSLPCGLTRADLHEIVEVLNQTAGNPVRDLLRSYVLQWIAAGNLATLLANDPFLNQWIRSTPKATLDFSRQHPNANPGEPRAGARVKLIYGDVMSFSEIAKFYHRKSPEVGQQTYRAIRKAILLFTKLMVNKDLAAFHGPCRCGKFWVPRRLLQGKHENVFCSKKCANAAMAQRFQQRKHQKQLARLKQCISRFGHLARAEEHDWKRWVSLRSGIDKRFITRALNRGEIEAPNKTGSRRHGRGRSNCLKDELRQSG